MAGILLSEETVDEILQLITSLALRTVPAVTAGSVSLIREDELTTAAYSHDEARVVDEAQYEDKAGPCVEATLNGSAQYVRDVGEAAHWPGFKTAATAHNFASVLSLPLAAGKARSGALNLYASQADAFDERDQEVASM
ncbi:MAG TPA: GAF domain-containing protein, partial [Actinomycetota bacterium]|nr:GAF domain-containing protein [Actinomycetota bacterium]